MQVQISYYDEQVARRAGVYMEKLADSLRKLGDLSRCELFVTHGVVLVRAWDRNGTLAEQCIGVTPIRILQWDKPRLDKLTAHLLKKLRSKQMTARAKAVGLALSI